jgi:phospholipase C
MPTPITRRDLLRTTGAAATAAGLAGLGLEPWVERALAAKPRPGALKDIQHVVILMQENRSFDHYFGTYKGVRGFSDANGRAAFTQAGYPNGNGGSLQPFHVDIHAMGGDCTPDITHDWGPQHRAWNNGAMDRFVAEHVAVDGPQVGPLTMAHYQRSDLAYYYALADAFTICDRYHCSVIGPTDPNRLYSMSGTLDPAGANGGPHMETLVLKRGDLAGKFTWTTYPEQLSARGISWKVYTDPGGGAFQNVLPYFNKFQTVPGLKARGIQPSYKDFFSDITHNRLPKVSWVLPEVQETEHPEFGGPFGGMTAARQIISALTKKKSVWEKTALLLTWDENGGFFDHVAPPVAPAGTAGEFVTAPNLPDAAQGIRGPIGLGFRVPMIVISPFSRGGFVCSDVFDHTSMLRFLERRFGAEVPNLSAWRRQHTGDLTSAFNFVKPNNRLPHLPGLGSVPGPHLNCGTAPPPPIPANSLPKQESGRPKRPHGLRGARKH